MSQRTKQIFSCLVLCLLISFSGCSQEDDGASRYHQLVLHQHASRIACQFAATRPTEFAKDHDPDSIYHGPTRDLPQVKVQEPKVEPTLAPDITVYDDIEIAGAISATSGNPLILLVAKDPSDGWIGRICQDSECKKLLNGWVVCSGRASDFDIPYERSIVVKPYQSSQPKPIKCGDSVSDVTNVLKSME